VQEKEGAVGTKPHGGFCGEILSVVKVGGGGGSATVVAGEPNSQRNLGEEKKREELEKKNRALKGRNLNDIAK